MKRKLENLRSGMAIPLVILFVIITFTFFTSMTLTRQRVRKQNLMSFSQKQAYYMAMGGIQHALLKIRILQRNAYDAACLSRGVCPFFNMVGDKKINLSGPAFTNKTDAAMDIFLKDLRSLPQSASSTDKVSFSLADPRLTGANPWFYEVSKISVLSYHTSTSASDYGTVTISIGIEAIGSVFDERKLNVYRKELVEKEVFIERKLL